MLPGLLVSMYYLLSWSHGALFVHGIVFILALDAARVAC